MFTQMFQSSCFMGQWFMFVNQLWQMLLRLCPVLFALLYDTVPFESSLALKMVALRLRYANTEPFVSSFNSFSLLISE
jgi:hypothetical protein